MSRSKKIVVEEDEDDGIYLPVLEGEGGSIEDVYKRLKNVFTNETSIETDNILKKYGDWSIVRYRVHRDPIQSVLKKILNTITGGKFKKGTEAYDDVFHLYAIFEIKDRKTNATKYLLTEKRPNINWEVRKTIGTGKKQWSPNGFYEGLDDSYRDNIAPQKVDGNFFTLREMLEGYMKKYPNSYWKYDSLTNNCQIFIKGLLNAIGDHTLDDFILQDLSQAITPIAKDVARGVTNLGALFGRIFGAGEGIDTHDSTKKGSYYPVVYDKGMQHGGVVFDAKKNKFNVNAEGVPRKYIRNEALRKIYDLADAKNGYDYPAGNFDNRYSQVYPNYYFWDKENRPSITKPKIRLVKDKYPANYVPWGQAL